MKRFLAYIIALLIICAFIAVNIGGIFLNRQYHFEGGESMIFVLTGIVADILLGFMFFSIDSKE